MSGQVSFLGELLKAVLAVEHLLLQMAAHVVVKLNQVYVGLAALGSCFAVLVPALYQPVVRFVAVLPVKVVEYEVLVRGRRFTVAQQVGVEVMAVNSNHCLLSVKALAFIEFIKENVLDLEVELVSHKSLEQAGYVLGVNRLIGAFEFIDHHPRGKAGRFKVTRNQLFKIRRSVRPTNLCKLLRLQHFASELLAGLEYCL